MQEELKNKERVGLGVITPTRKELPAVWAAHMLPLKSKLPTGLLVHQMLAVGQVCDARHSLIKEMQKINTKYIVFIDTDVLVPYDAIAKWFYELETTDKRIITGFYYGKQEPSEPIVYKKFGAGAWFDIGPQGYVKVEAAGLGCCMIDMTVFDEIEEPYFIVQGTTEDIYFFKKVLDAGIGMWCDTDSLCPHYAVNQDRFYPDEDKYLGYLKRVEERRNNEKKSK